MNIGLFKNRNGLGILACVILAILIYSVDVAKLAYQMTDWNSFGDMPITAGTLQYFIPDTPNVIGYNDPNGLRVDCATTVAYVQTDAGETYRCCDTGETIACLTSDFSNEIPVMDEACLSSLRETFAIPAVLEGAKDYQLYGSCSESSSPLELAVAQIDANGQILWRSLNAGNIIMWSSALRCVGAPLLLILAIVIFVITIRTAPKEPIPRF